MRTYHSSVNTSVITAYHPNTTLDVVAGTGKFNGSYVESFLQSFNNTVPFWALASAYSFIENSFFSMPSNPVSCPKGGRQCNSYLLPGGTYLMYPQLSPPQSSNTVVSIYNASATQLEFSQGLASSDKFSGEDCTVYGDENSYVAVKFCLAQSQSMAGALIAEVSACTNGTSAGDCLTTTSGFAPNISTTLTVYNRQATTVCSSTNNSILSVSDLGTPVTNSGINVTDLNLAVGWLLNYTAAGIPPESSINFMFWFDPSSSYESLWETNAYNTLQSLLGFVIWEFSENNNGNPAVSDPEAKGQMPVLPEEFHTQASICETYLRFVINWEMFIVYVVLEGVVIMLCWAIVGWHISRRGKAELPEISSYPIVDFASKVETRGEGEGEWNLQLREKVTLKEGDKAVRNALAGVAVRVRHIIPLS
ncbi:hypothetical protein BDZ45DRAFT_607375 [Acephala macrosclerotiorum]|nr:hypothetical protein BDZ45DRAFT_607375 [Acephala macrosclerotiorum]